MSWVEIAISALLSSTLVGMIVFLFRDSIQSSIRQSMQKDVARAKHELDLKKEIIKDELSQSAYKTQLMLSNIHAIYPELVEKLEIAFGAVNKIFGLNWTPDYSHHNTEDFLEIFNERKVPKGKQEYFLSKIATDFEKAVGEIDTYFQDGNYGKAQRACLDAKNFQVLKTIYCSDEVLKAFDDCYKSIWAACNKLTVGRRTPKTWDEGVKIALEECPDKMEAFRKAVRAELRIGSKSPTPSPAAAPKKADAVAN